MEGNPDSGSQESRLKDFRYVHTIWEHGTGKEIFACKIRNPGLWSPEIQNHANDWNLESKFHWQGIQDKVPENKAWNPNFKTVSDYFTWGEILRVIPHEKTSYYWNKLTTFSTNLLCFKFIFAGFVRETLCQRRLFRGWLLNHALFFYGKVTAWAEHNWWTLLQSYRVTARRQHVNEAFTSTALE